MFSRGALIKNRHVTTTEYRLKVGKLVYDAKVLIGTTPQQHGLPDFSQKQKMQKYITNTKYTWRCMDYDKRKIRTILGYWMVQRVHPIL